jgi:hypothetical protein
LVLVVLIPVLQMVALVEIQFLIPRLLRLLLEELLPLVAVLAQKLVWLAILAALVVAALMGVQLGIRAVVAYLVKVMLAGQDFLAAPHMVLVAEEGLAQ